MRVLEVASFLTLSGALHVAALSFAPFTPGGGAGGGQAGAADVTVQAATPTLAAMVETWTRPPEISDAPTLVQPAAQAAPHQPATEHHIARNVQTPSRPIAPDQIRLPQAETRLPAPPTALAATALPVLTAPSAPSAAPVLPHPTRTAAPRPSPAAPTLRAPKSAALPDIDTTPPVQRTAPVTSARPVERPERPKIRTSQQTQPQSVARPAQKARGTGQQPAAKQAPSRSKAPVASGPSKAQLAQAQAQWGARIRSSIARAQRYPNGTRARGTVILRISVSPSGSVVSVSLAQSSGDARLDQAAMSAVQRARIPRAPSELTAGSYRFSLPLSFQR